ncbi:MAG: SpoIIE family protein phosphatase [Candidatus Eremiobacteraeota bacterium]|nr:SpoIIE family protein phosphatase [Candidatus Eremiobacteraeota bacterium]MBC5801598.1 SpoIIE family protein phosphatase [Candidatus Eremiobacteraeota bacterium]
MMSAKRTFLPQRGVPGVALLGTLVLAIVIAAILISLRIYTGLDSAARVERSLVTAQQQLDDVVLIQLDQEAGLRGYVASGASFFLDDEAAGHRRFSDAVDAFGMTTTDLGIREMQASVAELRSLHATWEHDVAAPLRTHPRDRNALMRQTLGKVLTDQLRANTSRVHLLLEQRLEGVQRELRRRIDEALAGGLAFVLVFSIIAFVFLSVRAKMVSVLNRERSIIDTLQTAFRTDLDALPGTRIGTAYTSADEDAAVGGDLFDVRRLDARHGLIVIADISGKGVEAAVNTAFVKYSIRTLALVERDPAVILGRFNQLFLNTVKDPNLFVVAFVGMFDSEQAVLTYASAGHSGAWQRRGRVVEALEVTGPVVGLDASFGYQSRALALQDGDLIVLATDGLTEARTESGEMLDGAGAALLVQAAPADPQGCADSLIATVRRMGGGALHDDLALIAIAIDARREAGLPAQHGEPASVGA